MKTSTAATPLTAVEVYEKTLSLSEKSLANATSQTEWINKVATFSLTIIAVIVTLAGLGIYTEFGRRLAQSKKELKEDLNDRISHEIDEHVAKALAMSTDKTASILRLVERELKVPETNVVFVMSDQPESGQRLRSLKEWRRFKNVIGTVYSDVSPDGDVWIVDTNGMLEAEYLKVIERVAKRVAPRTPIIIYNEGNVSNTVKSVLAGHIFTFANSMFTLFGHAQAAATFGRVDTSQSPSP